MPGVLSLEHQTLVARGLKRPMPPARMRYIAAILSFLDSEIQALCDYPGAQDKQITFVNRFIKDRLAYSIIFSFQL